MITHEQALEILLNNASVTEKEHVPIQETYGRILAEVVFSDMNMPPFNKSAVDGFACRREDLHSQLRILEVIMAGKMPQYEITRGSCSKIMTGAPVPEGADTVFMVEDSELKDKNTVIFTAHKTASNICRIGEDIEAGQKMIDAGTLLKPWHIGILASVGVKDVSVYKKIKVGIITTGDELLEPGQPLVDGKIRNSNAYQLLSSCATVPSVPTYYGIVIDELSETTIILKLALSENDVVLLTGGVSLGDFDFVPKALEEAGMKILFDSIAMQPGRPLTYATNGYKHCFGLPGNPVSSMIQFELSVKPLIYKMMGHTFSVPLIPLEMGEKITRKKTGRKSFYPVSLNNDHTVTAVSYHGSAHINAFTDAYGIIAMEQGVATIEKGEIVYVRPL
jgi:molybdopterin molybdotransferase